MDYMGILADIVKMIIAGKEDYCLAG
jgi:hypothetical protein